MKRISKMTHLALGLLLTHVSAQDSGGYGGYGGYDSGSSGSYGSLGMDLTGSGPSPCAQPTPIFVVAIWLPISIPLVVLAFCYGIYYKRQEKFKLKEGISFWGEQEQKLSNKVKAESLIKYEGIVVLGWTRGYFSDIFIDFSKNIVHGTGKNMIGEFTTEGEINGKITKISQTYLIAIEDSADKQQSKLEAIFYQAFTNTWDSPCFVGMCEMSNSNGIIVLFPRVNQEANEISFNKLISQIVLFKNSFKTWLIFALIIIFSIASIVVSLTFSSDFTNNLYFSSAEIPFDTYINIFPLVVLLLHAKFSKYGALDGFSCPEFLTAMLNIIAMSLNTAFGIIKMIVAYWIYSGKSFSFTSEATLKDKFGEDLFDEINRRCFRNNLYSCTAVNFSSGNCELNIFCVGFNQSTFNTCEEAQEDLFSRVFFISISSLIQFVCWGVYFYVRKDSFMLRLKVIGNWLYQKV